MKFSQIRKLIDVLIEEDELTVSGIKPEITIELGEESIRQLNQDIHFQYPAFLCHTTKLQGSIDQINIQGHIINIKKK